MMEHVKMWAVNQRDWVHALITAVFASVFGVVYESLKVVIAHNFDFAYFDWKMVAGAAAAGFMGYIQKKFFSDENNKVLGKV